MERITSGERTGIDDLEIAAGVGDADGCAAREALEMGLFGSGPLGDERVGRCARGLATSAFGRDGRGEPRFTGLEDASARRRDREEREPACDVENAIHVATVARVDTTRLPARGQRRSVRATVHDGAGVAILRLGVVERSFARRRWATRGRAGALPGVRGDERAIDADGAVATYSEGDVGVVLRVSVAQRGLGACAGFEGLSVTFARRALVVRRAGIALRPEHRAGGCALIAEAVVGASERCAIDVRAGFARLRQGRAGALAERPHAPALGAVRGCRAGVAELARGGEGARLAAFSDVSCTGVDWDVALRPLGDARVDLARVPRAAPGVERGLNRTDDGRRGRKLGNFCEARFFGRDVRSGQDQDVEAIAELALRFGAAVRKDLAQRLALAFDVAGDLVVTRLRGSVSSSTLRRGFFARAGSAEGERGGLENPERA